jgi:hypothetical protein
VIFSLSATFGRLSCHACAIFHPSNIQLDGIKGL